MTTKIWAALVAIWKILCWFNSKAKVKQEKLDTAESLINEGMTENDTSKITAGFNRINRS
jgi:hypothetical protein